MPSTRAGRWLSRYVCATILNSQGRDYVGRGGELVRGGFRPGGRNADTVRYVGTDLLKLRPAARSCGTTIACSFTAGNGSELRDIAAITDRPSADAGRMGVRRALRNSRRSWAMSADDPIDGWCVHFRRATGRLAARRIGAT
jgi:hypothetical protein